MDLHNRQPYTNPTHITIFHIIQKTSDQQTKKLVTTDKVYMYVLMVNLEG